MIICHCHAVSDVVVRAAILAGARDIDDIGRECRAGTDCGGCRLRVMRLLGDECPVVLRVAS